jgi:hypothetical protein
MWEELGLELLQLFRGLRLQLGFWVTLYNPFVALP